MRMAVGLLFVVISDSLAGVVVWALMQSLGEVTTLFPIHGGFIEVSHESLVRMRPMRPSC